MMFARTGYLRVASSVRGGALSRHSTTTAQTFRAANRTLGQRNMATSSKIHLEASQQPEFFVKGIGADTADTASELLQQNHEKHHIFFNQSGFHVCIRFSQEFLIFFRENVTDLCARTTSFITSSLCSRSTPHPRSSKKDTMTMHRTNALPSRWSQRL